MKEEKNLKIPALCKKAVFVIVDFILYFLANTAIVYLTMGGHVRATDYSSILFSDLHLIASRAGLYGRKTGREREHRGGTGAGVVCAKDRI